MEKSWECYCDKCGNGFDVGLGGVELDLCPKCRKPQFDPEKVERYSLMSSHEGYVKVATGEFVLATDFDKLLALCQRNHGIL